MGSSTRRQVQLSMAQTRVESCAMSALGSMELPGASYGSNSATPTGSANGTAVLRTRMAGGVGAGVRNGSCYPISTWFVYLDFDYFASAFIKSNSVRPAISRM